MEVMKYEYEVIANGIIRTFRSELNYGASFLELKSFSIIGIDYVIYINPSNISFAAIREIND